jgi:glycosyltransferase involved in cell wall biosynthesis
MIPRQKIVIINNQIMPYRIALFNAIHRRNNVDLVVLYSSAKAPDRDWLVENFGLGFPHRVLWNLVLRFNKNEYGDLRLIWLNPTLFFHLIWLNPDVVIGYEYSVPAMIASLYARFFGKHYVTWTEMTGHTSRNLGRGQELTRKVILKHADAAMGTSEAACEYLQARNLPASKIFLGGQPVDIAWFKDQSRRRRSSKARPLTIIYSGYLNSRKGVKYLLEAFLMVTKTVPDVMLKLAGSGPQLETLKQFVVDNHLESRVEFLGFVEPVDMPAVYAAGDIYVLPSLEDTFGVVAVEAIASDLALVCSKYAGFSSHMTHGENGFIVDPQNTVKLCDMILQLRDEALRARFNKNAQDMIQTFSPDNVARQFEDVIHFVSR